MGNKGIDVGVYLNVWLCRGRRWYLYLSVPLFRFNGVAGLLNGKTAGVALIGGLHLGSDQAHRYPNFEQDPFGMYPVSMAVYCLY